MKKIKRLKYRRAARTRPRLPVAGLGRRATEAALDEHLTGVVQNMNASAGEERSTRSLDKNANVIQYWFRIPIGAARNMPGWKELDLLVLAKSGVYYAIEVDSAFTHRQKASADILHDAIVLNELEYLGVYPHVFHVGDSPDSGDNLSVANQDQADETFRRIIA